MSYIGRDISNLSDRAVLDSISTSATATFNLLLNSVAYVPSSAESLTVSLNGVIQKPQSSYTVSGSTIVFASNLASSDVIDFILAERAITLTTVGSGSVGTSQLVNNSVTSEKLASGLALGKIGQVVYGTTSSSVTTTSSSFGDSNLTASITPSSTNSKILVIVNLFFKLYGNSTSTGAEGNVRLVRTIGSSATNLYTTNNNPRFNIWGNNTGFQMDTWVRTHRDSASTTSECNYKIQIASQSGAFLAQADGEESQIVLMEVLA